MRHIICSGSKAAKHHTRGLRIANPVHEPLCCSSTWNQAPADLGLAKLSIIRCNQQVCRQRKFTACTSCHAVHGSNHGLTKGTQNRPDPIRPSRTEPLRCVLSELQEIATGAEVLASALNQNDPGLIKLICLQ
jgi:hypothetical protein